MQEPLLLKPNGANQIKPKSRVWILHALFAGFALGVGNYLVALMSDQGAIALSYVGLVAFSVLMIYRGSQMVRNMREFGTPINYDESNFFTRFREFKSRNIIPLIGNGVTNLLNLVAMTYAFKYGEMAGINQGVLLTLNSLAAVYNIIIFYTVFRERITFAQLFGILMMLCCVGLLSLNSHMKSENEIHSETGETQRYYAFLSIACGLLSPMALSVKHIFIRFYKQGYSTWDMAIDGLILEYSIYIMMAIYYIFIQANSAFNWSNMIIGCFASLFLMSGKISIALAVAEGLAGPATSLANS